MEAIVRKELADYFTSIRCFILFLLVFLASAAGLYAAFQGIRGAAGTEFVFLKLFTTAGTAMPPMISFMAIFVPIIGIALGFDAINSERSSGTLSRLLSQPVYRDNVINAKFLAGIVTLTILITSAVVLVAGYGLRMIGVPPSAEEFIRLFIYLVTTIVFGAFWMGMAVLFSILFRRIATSLLASIAVWLFFFLFYTQMIVPAVAKTIETYLAMLRFSPTTLYEQATAALLQPTVRSLGIITQEQANYMVPNPLSLGQSLVLIWPELVSMIALTIICFGISYVLFMRQEVRSS